MLSVYSEAISERRDRKADTEGAFPDGREQRTFRSGEKRWHQLQNLLQRYYVSVCDSKRGLPGIEERDNESAISVY